MSILTIAHDADDEALDICDRELQFRLPEAGGVDEAFVRYVCDRCGFAGPATVGPKDTIDLLRAQADALFGASFFGQCEAMR